MGAMLLTATAGMAEEKTPAFPGAEGFGRYTTGGRGGKVYHVTTLEDGDNTLQGSLRWALSQAGPRTIIFDVDGTINLTSSLNIPSNTTIAGQTAPGMGICVTGYPFLIKGDNVIVRYIRIRPGNKNVTGSESSLDSWDGFGALDRRDIIIDHCSVSWSLDECLSMCGNINTTVQWTIVAQSLVGAGHSKGNHGYGGNWGGSGGSYHHNLMVHHTSRAPRMGPRYTTQLDERVDMRNNVIYNWSGEGCYGAEAMNANIVNNYYKPGPGTKASQNASKQRRILAPGIRTTEYINGYPVYEPTWHIWGKFYINGNVNASYADVAANNWNNGVYNQIQNNKVDNTCTQATKDSIKLSTPIAFVHTTTQSAEEAYASVLAYVGACKGGEWDALDMQFINDTKNGTATATGSGLNAGFINEQDDNKAIVSAYGSALPTLTAGTAQPDTDGDGIPDYWETAKGLNPNDATDGNAKTLSTEGYTNLEVYMNSLVESITAACTTGTTEGQEDVPVSLYDIPASGSENVYVFQKSDSNVGAKMSISTVDGITLTFSDSDWESKGSASGATTSDGVDLLGYYACTSSNGDPVIFTTTKAGTLTIFFGGDINTSKSINMKDGDDNGLTGKVLGSGEEIGNGQKPSATIPAGSGIVYTLEANKSYTFFAGGTKWRLAAFRYVTVSTGIKAIATELSGKGDIYNLQGQKVKTLLHRGIYIINGKKVVK